MPRDNSIDFVVKAMWMAVLFERIASSNAASNDTNGNNMQNWPAIPITWAIIGVGVCCVCCVMFCFMFFKGVNRERAHVLEVTDELDEGNSEASRDVSESKFSPSSGTRGR
jgi:hypothetical protein